MKTSSSSPPAKMTLEQALEYIEEDELVEVTPPGAGISAKHHIQLCVRRRSCIKGYFRVFDESKLPKD
jgi:predicted membrane GTPase involved in stress response